MEKSVRRKVWAVRWRCSVNRLIENARRFVLGAGVLALAAMGAEKLLATGRITPSVLAALAGAGLLGAMIRWQLTRPSAMSLAILFDERTGLRERLSTLLALDGSSDPFARAAVEECRAKVGAVRPRDCFPIRLPPRSWPAPAVWGLVVLGWWYLPQGDVLGRQAKREQAAAAQALVRQTQAQTQAAVRKVRELAAAMNENLLRDASTDPATTIAPRDPQQARQAALRQISDLQKRVQEARAEAKFSAVEDLAQKLRQLRSPGAGPVRDLARQLARGQFAKAAAALQSLREQLMQKDMDPALRNPMARELENLARQLEQLAKQRWKTENELKKLGLNPELAKDLKKLQEALKKLGLDPDKTKKLMAMAESSCRACESGGELADALSSAASGLAGGKMEEAGDELAKAAEQLDSLEALKQQMQIADATLSDLKKTMESMGEGECPGCNGHGCETCGKGGKGPWREGLSDSSGSGMGGPGRGQGEVAGIKETPFKTEGSRVKGRNQEGPIIASLYIQGREVKGQSVRTFSEVTQAAEQEAAQDISDQRIPREYHEAVKKYFSRLHRSAQAPATRSAR